MVDATAVGQAVERKSVTEQLRELSSFDDLSDELAIYAGQAQPSAFRSSRAMTTRWIWFVPS